MRGSRPSENAARTGAESMYNPLALSVIHQQHATTLHRHVAKPAEHFQRFVRPVSKMKTDYCNVWPKINNGVKRLSESYSALQDRERLDSGEGPRQQFRSHIAPITYDERNFLIACLAF